MNLLPDEKFLYGGIQYTVLNAWHAAGKTVQYDLVSQWGVVQTQPAEKIHAHIDSGAITFIHP